MASRSTAVDVAPRSGEVSLDEAELQPWITVATGRTVRALQRVAYGASRATYLVEMEAGGDLVARVDTGDGPMAGTELSLVREAAVYRALAGTGVRIPRLHAVAPDGTVLLTDRAPGTHEVNVLPSAERHVVYDDYLDAIADLHDVDATALDLPGHRRPTDGPSHARNELDLWAGILDARTRRPWPLARYTLAVLRELAPSGGRPHRALPRRRRAGQLPARGRAGDRTARLGVRPPG